MSLGELSAPIRALWDLGEFGDEKADPSRICAEMIECGILSLELRETSPTVRPVALDIAARFVRAKRAVSLTIPPSAADERLASRLSGLPLGELLLHAESAGEVEKLPGLISRLERTARTVGASLRPTADNIRKLPEVLVFLSDRGVSRLALPIPRADEGSGFLEQGEREELARRLGRIDYRRVKVVLHDPLLWKALFPEKHHEEGCQAANSLVHITPRHDVYPCPILPAGLGNLRDISFGAALRSPVKEEIRSALRSLPEECAGCPKAPPCRGGCRGRAYVTHASLERGDPACGLLPR